MKLTKEEREMLISVERGEWKRVPNFEAEALRHREAARATLRKDKRVNIRMSERDLVRFQKAAMHEGLPYQTLISSVLHKYINAQGRSEEPDVERETRFVADAREMNVSGADRKRQKSSVQRLSMFCAVLATLPLSLQILHSTLSSPRIHSESWVAQAFQPVYTF